MGKEIVIQTTYEVQEDRETITLEQYRKKRVKRRKRVARRLAKRFPLFAVEFAREEFPNYDYQQFEKDLEGARLGKKKKGKSQLARQGRYPFMKKALAQYQITKDQKYLEEAQQWRQKMFLPFEVVFKLNGKREIYTFPSTTPVRLIEDLAKITFSSWEELEEKLEEKLKWIHVS